MRKTPLLIVLVASCFLSPIARGEIHHEQADPAASLRDLDKEGFLSLQEKISIRANTRAIVFQAPTSCASRGCEVGANISDYAFKEEARDIGRRMDFSRPLCELHLRESLDVSADLYLESGRRLNVKAVRLWPEERRGKERTGAGAKIEIAGDPAVEMITCELPEGGNGYALNVEAFHKIIGMKAKDDPVLNVMIPAVRAAPLTPPAGAYRNRRGEDPNQTRRTLYYGQSLKDLERSGGWRQDKDVGIIMVQARIDIPAHATAVMLGDSPSCLGICKKGPKIQGYRYDDARPLPFTPAEDKPRCELRLRSDLDKSYRYYIPDGTLLAVGKVDLHSSAAQATETGGTIEPLEEVRIEVLDDGAVDSILCDLPSSVPTSGFTSGPLNAVLGHLSSGEPAFDMTVPVEEQAPGGRQIKDIKPPSNVDFDR